MRNLVFIVPLLPLLVACGGRVPSDADDDRSVAPEDAHSDAPDASDAAMISRSDEPGDADTFECPSFQAPFTRYNVGAIRCSLATEFCVSNVAAGARSCEPFGSVCHSCECVIRGLSDPNDHGYVPFNYAPPAPNANGCFGDASAGVSLYLTE
jgi:hypothetical protein